MQTRLVDAMVVRREKARAVRQIHQNTRDERTAGLAKKELMEALEIWDEDIAGDYAACSDGRDHGDPVRDACGDIRRRAGY